ncbi:MAG: ABC transporter permease [Chloroflexi bacterium]|nr:ABC transporter permease [Chloroflexota bacterium]
MSVQTKSKSQNPQVIIDEELGEILAVRPTSLWRDAYFRLVRNKLAILGMLFVILMIVFAIVADAYPKAYDKQALTYASVPPGEAGFVMGADYLGRDMLSRLLKGAQVSLMVGLGAQVIVLLIGIPVGMFAGYYGGRTDMLLMRVVDIMYAFPQLLFVILLTSMMGADLRNIFIAIGLTGWVGLARQVRAQVLSLREREYVKAARVAGASGPYIIVRHLIPNTMTIIIVALTFGIPLAIFTESTLSYLGLGIKPPLPSWGQMVGEYQQYIRTDLHMVLSPALALGLTMLGFTFFGDGLRDALDPRMNR